SDLRRVMRDREGEDPAAAGGADPFDVGHTAVRAAGARRMPEACAPPAALDAQLAPRAPLPEFLRVDVGMQRRELGQKGHHHLRIKSELVGRFDGPAVTSAISASVTWAVEVPRSWRTPSITCVMPSR